MRLHLRNIGQITDADLQFGDLTVLVGPQASGKSIALQFLKLVLDMGSVQEKMLRYGLDWGGKRPLFFDMYFGEGMRALWRPELSKVAWDGEAINLRQWIKRARRNRRETAFFIPAQRVLAMRDGLFRPFSDFRFGDPFAVRDFSENLRILVDQELGTSRLLFPLRRLKREFRKMLDDAIFRSFKLHTDRDSPQRRLVLSSKGPPLPFMVWSAGQREFVPLLLGLMWLMPSTRIARRGNIRWVVIEEPEMGLHPRAVGVVLLMALELVARGYRVCLSTHSPQVLEIIWALKHLRESGASPKSLLGIFEAPTSAPMQKLAATVMEKSFRVHYFDPETGRTHDITELDVDAEETGEGGWGGLSEFSGRVNTFVARAVANANGGADR
jgi:hypothetical protein